MELRPSTIAWGVLIGGVATYDILCPQNETLSEGVDRAMEHPVGRVLALGGIALTALHLANVLPKPLDPFAHALSFKDR